MDTQIPSQPQSTPDFSKKTTKHGIRRFLFRVTQIKSSKPRSVKVCQWIFFLIAFFFAKSFIADVSISNIIPGLNASIFLLIFLGFYLYTKYSLFIAKIVAFAFLAQIVILLPWLLLNSSMQILGLDFYQEVDKIIKSLEGNISYTRWDVWKVITVWGVIIQAVFYLPPIVLLWIVNRENHRV